MESFFRLIRIVLPFTIMAICLFLGILHSQSGVFCEFEAALLSLQWMLLVCMAVWCASFIFLMFSLNDLPLIGLLLIAITMYFSGEAKSPQMVDATILLAGVALGKGACVLLNCSGGRESALTTKQGIDQSGLTSAATFLIGLVGLLAFSSWWHLAPMGAYRGPRWMGLWDNPNIYGMLMGLGTTLAIALLVLSLKFKVESPKSAESAKENKARNARSLSLQIILFIAAGMMAVGLFFSYSRGAWFGMAVGLLYLAWYYGKLKWKYVVLGVGLVVLGIVLFWGRTADSAPWYLKRLDLSRPSAQHRVSAWRGALQMMRDHPLGVGWNHAVSVYGQYYSPPEGGAAALTTNSYLMLGTELGLPGLLCFLSYIALCFLGRARHSVRAGLCGQPPGGWQGTARPALELGHRKLDATQVACRAGALVFVVAFWFDGGLFDLPTAAMFWVLLELGAAPLEPASARPQASSVRAN